MLKDDMMKGGPNTDDVIYVQPLKLKQRIIAMIIVPPILGQVPILIQICHD